MSKGDLGPRPLGGRSKGDGGGRPSELLMVELARSCCTRPLGMSKGEIGERPTLIIGPCPRSPPGCPMEGSIDGSAGSIGADATMGKSKGDAPERIPPLVSCRSIRSKGDIGQEGCGCQLPACLAFCCCCGEAAGSC